ncbi:SMC-Scp complex subunit ScpB [Rubinisphaera italica]|uniref:Segregation and condensation protein B n=1 Tax=Rubinisphaera italica TaxID=2527969 RepID=A0A5C5XKX8_9PLAN|nr:SMC-Scp complex subunit ScpB [Rubinisphaera italica]TWT63590.1 Segregation and condensation protein B [Rubinisphaera italica]
METEPESSEAASQEGVFSEAAIEEAYQMALRASEEAGVMPPAPELLPEFNTECEAGAFAGESDAPVENAAVEESATETFRKPKLTAEQIIEALLFVGGEKLSAKKLAGFISHQCHDDTVRTHIETINKRYQIQKRPYEIILGKEGYQMALRPEFQRQRNFTFGLGPREVKLPPDALEVLSFIAFRQPLLKEDLETIDRPNVMSSLRQLIRRELVSAAKREDGTIEYRTTDRFLDIFGLSNLQDLPRAPDLNFK